MTKKLIVALIILFLLAAGIFFFLTTGNIGGKYNTVEVEKGKLEKFIDEVGTISSRNVRSYYGNNLSRVERINFDLGDHVEKGQLVIEFEDNIDLEIRKIEKQIEAVKASYNEVLSGAEEESVSSAKIEIASIKNSIDLASKNKKRLEELYKNEAVAESELEQAIYNLEQLQSKLSLAQNNYKQLVKAPSENMKSKYAAEIDLLHLSLEKLKQNKEHSMIHADFAGVITELNTFAGDTPSSSIKILEILDPLEKVILVDFMVEDALRIKPGMKAEINDEELGIQIDNIKVQKIHPKSFTMHSDLGVEENRQRIELSFPKSNPDLSFGLKVGIRVMIEEEKKALFIAKDAVYEKDMKQYVEVLENGKTVEREVVIGIENNSHIEIKKGLKEGEKVILNYEKN